ncbi:MAG: M56 family metallopeptidase [Vicinamibacterales bacterium]
MIAILALVVRASVVLAAALAAASLLRRRSAGLRHLVLAAGIFAAASVVPLSLALPEWNLPVAARPPSVAFVTARVDSAATVSTAPVMPHGRLPIKSLALFAWLAGFASSAAMIATGLRRVMQLTRHASPLQNPRWVEPARQLSARFGVGEIALFETDTPDVLATWGAHRPCILLPARSASWSDARIHVVLCHELAHIRRGDWLIQIAAEMVRAAFWFNPLFWIACARLRRESEQACDDAVLEAGVAPSDYAWHLVEIARACRPASPPVAAALPIARPSTLEWRITAMLNTRLSRTAPSRRTLAMALLVLLAVTLPVASFRAAAQDGPLPFVGTVYDVSGAVLPAVTLTLEDAAGVKQTAPTDGSGRFEFAPIAAGQYLVSSAIPGFLPLRQPVTLKDARDWSRAITLQIGTLQETVTVTEERPAGVVAPAAQPIGAVRVGGNIRAPRKVLDVRPVYPQAMLDGGFEGLVPMEAQIGVDGSVTSVRVISAQVHPDLAKAAVDAVRQWRFTPTLLNGVAVDVFMTVAVEFKLPM